MAKFSFWLTIWSLSAILASRVDQIMLSNLMGLEKVAVYSMAFQFVYVYSLAQQSITTVLMPKMNSLRSNVELVQFCRRALVWLIPLTIIIGILIYPSKIIIGFVFGHKYVEALPVYLVLSFSMLINFIAIPFSLLITAFNRTHLVAFSGFLQLAVNLALNFVLIPRFGVIGAAYTFGLGIMLSFLYNAVCSWYLLRFKQINVV